MKLFSRLFNRRIREDNEQSQRPQTGREAPVFHHPSESPWVDNWTSEDVLPIEECARKGLESFLGLLIRADPFRRRSPAVNMGLCAEFYHAVSPEHNADFIGGYLRTVQWMHQLNGALVPYADASQESDNEMLYPQIGAEMTKVLIRPLSDGRVFIRWNPIDRTRSDESAHDVGMVLDDEWVQSWQGQPIEVAHIPPQPSDNLLLPAFLIMADTSASQIVPPPSGTDGIDPTQWVKGWDVFRYVKSRPSPEYIYETCIPVFPKYLPESTWHFRTEVVDGRPHSFRWTRGKDPEL